MRKIITTSAAAAATLALLACGLGSDPDGEGARIVDDTPAPTTEPAGEGGNGDAAAGTRDNPLSPGVAFEVGDWRLQFGPTNTDAGDIVAAENQFNEPPADGRQYVMVEVVTTYTGEESGHPWVDLSFAFHGSGGNTFGTGEDDFCGVIPNPLIDHGEMFPDASVTANVCVSVPAEQIDGGSWIVEAAWSLDGDRTFIALS